MNRGYLGLLAYYLGMSISGNKNMTPLILLSSLLLITSVIYGSSESNIKDSLSAQSVIKTTCTATLYPDICYSTVSDISQKFTTKKEVIELAINRTKETVQDNFHTLETLKDAPNLTKRAKMALDECLEMEVTTLEGLDKVIQDLREYPTKKSLYQYSDDLKTIMSTAITNKETCLDELSYDDSSWLRKSIIQGHDHGVKMCSNVLAMIKDMTETDIANNPKLNAGRKLNENEKGIVWPRWLSVGDRKLLGFKRVTPNVIVAKNGKGNYTTIAKAVAAAPTNSSVRYVIKITAGVYNEYVEVRKEKTNIMFIGDGRSNTIITGNKNVAIGGVTTINSATVDVAGDRFLARDITFQNTAGPSGHQAVALLVRSDLSAFYKCGFDAYQDTLYVLSNRQFFVKCLVVGTVDFIFGNAAVVFQFCDIMARKPNPHQKNMLTAQGRTDKNQDTGIVIQKCNIGATSDLKPVQDKFPTYLGRPWKEFSRTVVMRSIISDVIKSEGWHPWNKSDFAQDTLYYREYRNMGPGSDTSMRVTWKGWGVIKDNNEARPFTVARFINGWTWLLSTGFPFWPGL